MESRANYALVGLFTLAVIGAMFGFVFWFNSGAGSSKRQEIRIVFSGTVTGLGRGSNVLFNGLRVGEVASIQLQPDDPRRIYAVAEIDKSTPLRADTRARLEAQGLAGVVAVQLLGGEPESPQLEAGPGQSLPTIIAERSEFQDLLETVRTISKRADDVLGSVERMVRSNEGAITNTVRNVEKFSAALGNNSDGVDRLMASFGRVADTITPLADRLQSLSDDISGVVRSIDQRKITATLDNVERFTAALGNSGEDVGRIVRDAGALVDRLNRAVDPRKLASTLDNVEKFSAVLGSSTGDFGKAVREVSALAEKLNGAADQDQIRSALANIDRFTATLGNSGEDVTRILKDTGSLVDRLNRAVDPQKLASTLDNVEKFSTALGASTGDFGRAVRDLSALADKVNGSVDQDRIRNTIANIDRFAAALGGSSDDASRAVGSVASIAQKLDRAADQIDGVLKGAQNFLNSAAGEEGQGALAEVSTAARSIRVLADNLDKRTAEITSGINRFTGPGLREIETLASDGRRTLTDLNRTLRTLERNPQQFIFGGKPPLPQYGGAR